MKKILVIVAALLIGLAAPLHAQTPSTPDRVPRMSIEQLREQMSDPTIVIIDVRISHDWEGSTMKIKGAIREDASKVGVWMAKYPPDKTLVFYCA